MSEDLATEAWRALRELVFAHDRRQAVVDALGLGFGRVKLIRHLAGGPLTLRELSAELGVDAPYVTVMVDDLERRRLVERIPHPVDRRAKHVRLTPSGRRTVAKAEAVLDQPPPGFRERSPEELRQLLGLLAPRA